MGTVLNQLIGQFETMEKKALAKIAEDPMGNENSAELTGVPGAEHDVNVPAEAKKPDPEVAQGQPSDAASTEGAVSGGDAKPLEEGKMTVEEPVLNPDQKPMVTDEAYAKEASAKVSGLINDLLASISAPEKKAAVKSAPVAKDNTKQAENGASGKLVITEDLISKLAEAVSAYNMGKDAAQGVMKKAQEAAPAETTPAEAAPVETGAAPAEAVPAEAAEPAGEPADVPTDIPPDVTPQELGEAIVDLVGSGELDPDTAKAIVDQIASAEATGEGGEEISEDDAANIIADGIASGEITPEDAEAIAAELEGGATEDPAAAGAAGAEAAIADAADEARGAADAEAAIKSASAEYRKATVEKIASAVSAKRAATKQAEARKVESPLLNKVAGILIDRAKNAAPAEKTASDLYAEGFTKRAMELGANPQKLAQYALNNMGNK